MHCTREALVMIRSIKSYKGDNQQGLLQKRSPTERGVAVGVGVGVGVGVCVCANPCANGGVAALMLNSNVE